MNISGKILVFKNEYGYSTSISRKNQNGEYDRMYINVQLPKGFDVKNKTYIEISKGFLSFYNDKNGLPKVKIVVMEVNQESSNISEPTSIEEPAETLLPDDLPF